MKRKLYLFKFLISIILMTNLFSTNIYSTTNLSFSDVTSTDWFYQDLTTLIDKGIINGYTDGKFRPSKSVSVAEFIKMSLLATNQDLIEPVGSFWYSKYVETAILQGYITSGTFNDYSRAITRGEMGHMIDKILNLSYENTKSYINKIVDYEDVASSHKESSVDVYIAGIITGYTDGTIKSNDLANRSEAAVVIIRMIDAERRNPPILAVPITEENSDPLVTSGYEAQAVTKSISVDGIQIGMREDYVVQHLGEPDERLPNQFGYEWFVYAGDYSTFKIIGIKDCGVVAFYSNVKIDSTLGLKIGSTEDEVTCMLELTEFEDYYYAIYEGMNIRLYRDKALHDGVEGVLVYDSKVINISSPTITTINSMEKVLFHLTNGARKANGLSTLEWSEEASLVAFNHSKDMAINEFFSHENLSGQNAKTRMQTIGIVGNYYAENIAAGYDHPFAIHYALMHSSGHKKNILTEDLTHLGVGIYYNVDATYKYYITEDFYQQR